MFLVSGYFTSIATVGCTISPHSILVIVSFRFLFFATLSWMLWNGKLWSTEDAYAEIIVLNLATILIIWLVLLIPSRIVSKISPSEIIKYE